MATKSTSSAPPLAEEEAPYSVSGLTLEQLSGSLVPLEDFPVLFVSAMLSRTPGEDLEQDFRRLKVIDVDARLEQLTAGSLLSRSDAKVILALEAQRVKQNDVRALIDDHIAAGTLRLIDPLTHIATSRRDGALLDFDETWVLLRETATPAIPAVVEGLAAPRNAGAEAVQATRKHSLRDGLEPDVLTPLIKAAQRECNDKWSAAEIWAVLGAWTDLRPPPVPLLGRDDDEGGALKYRSGTGTVAILNRKALGQRIRRARKREQP